MRTSTGPIREELFSAEQLEHFAGELAARQHIHPSARRGRRLLPRLRENARALVASLRAIADASRRDSLGFAGGRVAAEQLPHRRGAGPGDPGGPSAGVLSGAAQARRRARSRAIRASTGWPGRSSRTRTAGSTSRRFARFVRAYQRVQPLTIGELWALAISLRLVLVENLRRLAERVAARAIARDEADAIADAAARHGRRPQARAGARSSRCSRRAPFSQAFAVQLVQRLREQDPAVTPALEWLDRRLEREADHGRGARARRAPGADRQPRDGAQCHHEHAPPVVGRLGRLLRKRESGSRGPVRRDPRGGDGLSDAGPVSPCHRGARPGEAGTTSWRWRGGPWRWRRAPLPGARTDRADSRLRDPGYYLIAKGRRRLERELGFRVPGRQWLRRAWVRAATPLYLAAIAFSTLVVVAVPAVLDRARRRRRAGGRAARPARPGARLRPRDRAHPPVRHAAHGPAAPPQARARAAACPASSRTLVAIPMFLTDESEIDEVVQRLEVHYLGQSDPELRFALLSDWRRRCGREACPRTRRCWRWRAPRSAGSTSGTARPPAAATASGSSTAAGSGTRREGVWMGWERKRGKLRELNRLLRGATDTSFLPPDRGRGAGALGRPLRDHARRRFPASAGGGAPAGRNDRSSAEPSADSTRPSPASSKGTPSFSPG